MLFLTEYILDGFNPNNGDVILDCGAAHGDTLLLFKSLYPDSSVYSFEYEMENVKSVEMNIRENSLKDVYITQTFLYSNTGIGNLNKNTYKIVSSSNQETIVIKTLALDDFVEENKLENIGLIKFDIEGGGGQEALKGTVRTIKSQKPLLYIPIYHLQSDIYTIPEFLHSPNFEFLSIMNN